jgi:lipid A 3-O-deacylase
MLRRLFPALVLLAAAAFPVTSQAQPEDERGTLGFTLENDLAFGNDRYYTNGLRLSWVPGREPDPPAWAAGLAGLVPWFPAEGAVRHGYAFGQSIFTPRDISISDPPLDDRPYAGWLYGAIRLEVRTGQQLDVLAVSVGVVGPASLAERSQKFIHEILAGDEARGWDTQLANEPGIVLAYQRAWRSLVTPALYGAQWDFSPHAGAALGNVFTYGSAGAMLRIGRQLPADYPPARILPGLPGSGDFASPPAFRWYAFAGFEVRAVVRNLLLDGNTFRDSRSVDKKPLVSDLQLGIVLDWPRVRLSYAHVFRSQEFRSQTGQAHFGALGLLLKF